MGVLAGGEQLTEDLLQRAEVVDLAASHRRQRFIEEHHALIGAVVVDQGGAEIRQRNELEVAVTHPSSNRKRVPKARLPPRPVGFPHANVE